MLALLVGWLGAQEPALVDQGIVGIVGIIGVASGRATADGRPLLWLLLDAPQSDQVLHPFADGKTPYLGLCDAGNTTEVRGGANAAGFCLVDASAPGLPELPELPVAVANGLGTGALVKLALQRCATVADFVALLEETNTSGRRTQANFAVIDRSGAAAIFATEPTSFTRFDADQSPSGVLVRSNCATTNHGDRGRERLLRAEAICNSPAAKAMSHQFVLQQFLRDLRAPASASKGAAGQQDVRATMHRQTSVAALVCHGVQAKEDARLLTVWVLLGQPLFSIAVPCWPAAGGAATELCGYPRSALCDLSRRLQDGFYSGAGDADAMRWLLTTNLPAVRRDILFGEAELLARTAEQMEAWRLQLPAPEVQRALHGKLTKFAHERLAKLVARSTAAPVGK